MEKNNNAIEEINPKKEIAKLQGEDVETETQASGVEEETDSIWKKEEPKVEKKEEPPKVQYANKPEKTSNQILSAEPGDYVVDGNRNAEEELWHGLKTAMLKKTKLRGTIDEVGRTPTGMDIVGTYFEGQRIIIPMSEMGIILSEDKKFVEDKESRRIQMANNMIGAQIDFVIKAADKKTGSVVASRKEAVLDKIKTYYGELDKDKTSMVAKQPHVEARITAVNRKNLWVEVLGVQTQINAVNVFWEWVVDLRKSFSAGDKILVNVTDIEYPEPFENCINNENWLMGIKIKAEHKSFEPNYPEQNFPSISERMKCRATVTDYRSGIYFLQLASKVNAIAHSVAGNRKVMIGDTVSFLCQRKDAETSTAIGLITKVVSSEWM